LHLPPNAGDLHALERELRRSGFQRIAGVDEAGRGCLAGPVVAAAVILPPACALQGICDSKQLTPACREQLCEAILSEALSVGIGVASAAFIDSVNILRATHLAMRQAVQALDPAADFVLVDGLPVECLGAHCRAVVDGDRLCFSIAAASIVAKVWRDRIMARLDELYPGYGFARHMGYGTPEHLAALEALGPCPVHRRSFSPLRQGRLEL
jgi:ribonuclease HII